MISEVGLCQSNRIFCNEVQVTVMTTLALWLVDNIVFQDQQTNAELTKIMGEFTESGDQSPSASSKGDDLLAMMDGLWHGHPDRTAPGGAGAHCDVNSLFYCRPVCCLYLQIYCSNLTCSQKTLSLGAFKMQMWAGVSIGCQKTNYKLQICIVKN